MLSTTNAPPVGIAGPNSYPALVEAAWEDAHAPRVPDAPTVVSLFAGCGGSSLGYAMAGYEEQLAVEWDQQACASLRANFPQMPLYEGDIATLSTQDALTLARLEPGQLDVLDGSPPCQGFSTNGHRMLDDPRNQLFREYLRLLDAFQPRVLVMENVAGMVRGKMKLVFVEILRALKAAGYVVTCRALNAMYFHVPQSRTRLIFVGVRSDLGVTPTHPTAQRVPYTVAQAIDHLAIADDGSLANRIHPGQRWAVQKARPGEDLSKYHPKGYWFNYQRLPRHKPAPTLLRRCHDKVYHYQDCRVLDLQEARALASFPQAFQLIGTYEEVWQQIGNAVPPLFMKSIAEHINQTILTHVRQGGST